MKARVATVLSLTGVFVAGSAAALVNTQVLRNSAPVGNSIVRLVDDSGSSSSSPSSSSADPSSSVVSSVVPSSPSLTTAATAEPAELAAFQVDTSGLVTLDTAGEVLRIDSAVPAAGWQVTVLQQVDALNVKVSFQKGETVVEFRANLMFDKVTPSVSTYQATQGAGTSTSVTTTTTSSTGGGHSTSTTGTTRTTVDNGSKAPTTSDDRGGGRGGRGGDDDHSSGDD
jgi:hypothetical protein